MEITYFLDNLGSSQDILNLSILYTFIYYLHFYTNRPTDPLQVLSKTNLNTLHVWREPNNQTFAVCIILHTFVDFLYKLWFFTFLTGMEVSRRSIKINCSGQAKLGKSRAYHLGGARERSVTLGTARHGSARRGAAASPRRDQHAGWCPDSLMLHLTTLFV